MVKQRSRALISLIGLSFSMAIIIIIYLYVSGELRVNKFHENGERIYRMYNTVQAVSRGTELSHYELPKVGPAIKERIPGVENTCRLIVATASIGPGEELFQLDVGFVDSSFFKMFSYEIIAGDREYPLSHPKSVVLPESEARKIFADSVASLDEMVGLSVKFPEEAPGNLYTVTAIIADPPVNTSFFWDVLVPYENAVGYSYSNDYGGNTFQYVMLDENNDYAQLAESAQTLVDELAGKEIRYYVQRGFLKEDGHNFTYHFMPYREVYLSNSSLGGGYESRGNRNTLYILSSIAVLILLIACFNYVMISIGTALNRMGDFGMMNVVGARRWQILAQFMVESFLLTILSLFLGIILAEQILPLFNRLADEDLLFSLYSNGLNLAFLGVLLFFIVMANSTFIGIYLLRKNHPLRFLKREGLSVRRNGVARISIVLQFFMAITLLIAGAMILKQLHFLVNRDVGYKREGMAVIQTDFSPDKIRLLEEQFLSSPGVSKVSMSDRNLSSGFSMTAVLNKKGEVSVVRLIRVDPDYISTLGLDLIAGRNFYEGETDDSIAKVIVNETLLRDLGIEDPIGSRVHMDWNDMDVEIIGVIRDFHFRSMHQAVQPLMLRQSYSGRNDYCYLFVRAEEGQMASALVHCEKVWKELVPEITWKYEFLDEILEAQYKGEDRWSRIIVWAALIAIFLSCLGLVGISGIRVARRYQEVGIRKANGATVVSIIMLLNTDILKWVLLSYVLACPAAYFIIRRWLQDFAYRTGMSWWVFVLAGLVALLISVLTITLQIWRVARQNPVNALRYE